MLNWSKQVYLSSNNVKPLLGT